LFCWGYTLLFCLELGVAASQFHFSDALYSTGQSALSAIFLGYIFVHCMREPLVP